MKILLDSNGWIEFFTDGPRADRYAAYLTPRYRLITPTIVLCEVYKRRLNQSGERKRPCSLLRVSMRPT